MEESDILYQRLLAPFPVSALDLKPLDGTIRNGMAKPYCYPDIRAVTDRLVKCIGKDKFNISTDFHHISPYSVDILDKETKQPTGRTDTHFKACIGISISLLMGDSWVTRSNVGEAEKKSEVMTTAYSQAFKRSAVLFGLGRYLYDIDLPSFPYDRFKGFEYKKIFESVEFSEAVKQALKNSGFEFRCEVTGEEVDWKIASMTVAKMGRVLSAEGIKKLQGGV